MTDEDLERMRPGREDLGRMIGPRLAEESRAAGGTLPNAGSFAVTVAKAFAEDPWLQEIGENPLDAAGALALAGALRSETARARGGEDGEGQG